MVERFSVIDDPNLSDYTDFEDLGTGPLVDRLRSLRACNQAPGGPPGSLCST